MIGIVGGMGPAATVDLMSRLLRLTPAQADRDHVPLLVISDARMPELGPAILSDAVSPLPELLARVQLLERCGAQAIAIACHAAHHWFDELAAASNVSIIHIADAVLTDLAAAGITEGIIGILGAAAILKSGFYQDRLGSRGYRCMVPTQAELDTFVGPGIQFTKGGSPELARPLFIEAIESLVRGGAVAIVLACTEVPIALGDYRRSTAPLLIDGTEALARACVSFHLSGQR